MADNDKQLFTVKIQRVSADDERYIEGVVYAPYELDTYQEFMEPADVKLLAHRFMQDVTLAASIDTMHDNKQNGSTPVQSFITVKGDPRGYPEDAWVLGVKVNDDDIWEKVKKGEISGFSFEAYVNKMPAVIEVQYYPQVVGYTEVADGHNHAFVVDLNSFGRVIRGWTSMDADHTHEIKSGTATEENLGHTHRYFL